MTLKPNDTERGDPVPRGWSCKSLHDSLARGFAATLLLASALLLLSVWSVTGPYLKALDPHLMRVAYWMQEHGWRVLGLNYVQKGYEAMAASTEWTQFVDADKARYDFRVQPIGVLQFTERAHQDLFERRSPTPRGCVAEALQRLSARLARERPAGSAFPVVAIDIDVTLDAQQVRDAERLAAGSERARSCVDESWRIAEALRQLSEHATVIALALDRTTPGERISRNGFVAGTCSHDFKPGRGGVYYASAATFAVGTQMVFEAPWQLTPPVGHSSAACTPPTPDLLLKGRVRLPAYYPALGTLAGLARRAHDTTTLDACARDALTSLCQAVRAPSSPDAARTQTDTLLIDDVVLGRIDGIGASDVAQAYEFRTLNLLQAELAIRTTPLHSFADLDVASITAPTLIVALTDGSTADRFVTPRDIDEYMPGAYLQGALSVTAQRNLAAPTYPKTFKWLADFVAGLLFLGLAAPMHGLKDDRESRSPFFVRAAMLLLPLISALGVALFALLVSAWLLPRGWWFNPLYIVLGMTLHAYFEVTSPAAPHTKPARTETPGPWREVGDTLARWTDVDDPAPKKKRNGYDVLFSWAWRFLFLVVVALAIALMIKELPPTLIVTGLVILGILVVADASALRKLSHSTPVLDSERGAAA